MKPKKSSANNHALKGMKQSKKSTCIQSHAVGVWIKIARTKITNYTKMTHKMIKTWANKIWGWQSTASLSTYHAMTHMHSILQSTTVQELMSRASNPVIQYHNPQAV